MIVSFIGSFYLNPKMPALFVKMVKLEKISHAVKKVIHSIVSHSHSQSSVDIETSSIIESDFEHEKYRDKLGKSFT